MLPAAVSSSGRATRASIVYLALLCCGCAALYAWYASGWPEPGRFWDEMYAKQNVAVLLTAGRFEPANGFYPTLAYLPQTLALAGLEGIDRLLGLDRWQFVVDRTFTPQGYLASRFVCVVYAVASLALVWLLGLRLFSLPVATTAATLLAFTPWHVNRSAYFKPDSLVTLALLVFLYLAVRAVEHPSRARFAAAGAGIGLAMSCKFNAACAPAVLTLAAAAAYRRERRVVGHLLLAGLLSAVVFLALNPQLELFARDFFGRTTEHYQGAVAYENTGRLDVALGWVRFLFDRYAHGAVLGSAAFAGLGILALAARRGEIPAGRRTCWLLLGSFPVLLALALAAGTERVKYNNYVPILPVTSLFAAVAVCTAVERLVAGQRARVVAATALALIWTAPGGFSYVYRSMIPTTEDAAVRTLEKELPGAADFAGRSVVASEWTRPEPDWEGRRPSSDRSLRLVRISSSGEASAGRLERADGWIVPAAWLDDGRMSFAGLADPELRIRRLKPRWFRLRGPELVVASRPWARAGMPIEVRPDGESVLRLPQLAGDHGLISFELWVDRRTELAATPELLVGDQSRPLHRVALARQFLILASERFEALPEMAARLPALDPSRVARAVLHRWQLPASRRRGSTEEGRSITSRSASSPEEAG